MTVITTDSWQ